MGFLQYCAAKGCSALTNHSAPNLSTHCELGKGPAKTVSHIVIVQRGANFKSLTIVNISNCRTWVCFYKTSEYGRFRRVRHQGFGTQSRLVHPVRAWKGSTSFTASGFELLHCCENFRSVQSCTVFECAPIGLLVPCLAALALIDQVDDPTDGPWRSKLLSGLHFVVSRRWCDPRESTKWPIGYYSDAMPFRPMWY